MKVVYVAGPYRAQTWHLTRRNIDRAGAIGRKIWQAGAAAIVPHLNTAYFDGTVPDQIFLDGDLTILSRCDAVVLVEGWELSAGARDEAHYAEMLGKPVFRPEQWADFLRWLGKI